MTRPFSGTCPHCAQIDQVQRVPAIVGSGRSTYRESGLTVSGDPGGVSVGVQSNDGVAITDTARRLDFVPPSRPSVGNLAGCVSILMLMGGIYGVAVCIDQNAAVGWLWLLFFLGGVVLFVHTIRRIRSRTGPVPDVSAARAVWNSGWFCHRCGGAFFPVDTPHTVPTGKLLSPEEFREVVHDAGTGRVME